MSTTASALAWIGFDLAEVDTALEDVIGALCCDTLTTSEERTLCSNAASTIRSIKEQLRDVWDTLDAAATIAAEKHAIKKAFDEAKANTAAKLAELAAKTPKKPARKTSRKAKVKC